MMLHVSRNLRGFTLVEAVIVIAITGVIAAIVAVFIRAPVQSYFDSAARAALSDEADTTLRRMARDIRLALPNSIRIDTSGVYFELLLTASGGRYLAEEDDPTAGQILDFNNTGALSFDVVSTAPTITAGNSIVVYNLGPGLDPANAYCASATGCNNRAVVASIAASPDVPNATRVRLSANPFLNGLRSPSFRFQVVTMPVTYSCAGGTLTRYWNYTISASQPTPPSDGQHAVLATNVNCTFSYARANERSGLVGLGLTMTGKGDAGAVSLFQQVHVDNTP